MFPTEKKHLQTHFGTSPLHWPLSSQVLNGSPTTLNPRSHRYLAKAPILYDEAPTFEDSAVLINVLPYIRSLPVTDRMLCSAKTGSGHLISVDKKYLLVTEELLEVCKVQLV